jgi:predicted 2-oxoglutarate/Fe(II)-dependent dioxygenase YbiX
MIGTFDKLLLSDEDCNSIKLLYEDKLILRERNIRRQKNYHEIKSDSWLHEKVKNLIEQNLGEKYSLLERVTILKYEPGDFFSKHIDGSYNIGLSKTLPYHFYGGAELCERKEFKGGEFFIKDKNVEFKKGRLFTHGFDDTHGVKKVEEGIRWSIHFLIKEKREKQII